jgi:hypothetical protein
VVDMTRPASLAKLGSEFDNFLFTPIGEERNDMLLSVLSALARSNVDPWEEAALLAGLPEVAATQRLASLIAALPGRATTHPDPGTIAARLIQLLPRRTRATVPSRATVPGVAEVINPRALTFGIVVFMAAMLGAQFIIASYQPPAHVTGARTSHSAGAAPRTPPPSPDE